MTKNSREHKPLVRPLDAEQLDCKYVKGLPRITIFVAHHDLMSIIDPTRSDNILAVTPSGPSKQPADFLSKILILEPEM